VLPTMAVNWTNFRLTAGARRPRDGSGPPEATNFRNFREISWRRRAWLFGPTTKVGLERRGCSTSAGRTTRSRHRRPRPPTRQSDEKALTGH
jgi:hypothetical protein